MTRKEAERIHDLTMHAQAIMNMVNEPDRGQCWSCGNILIHKEGCAIFSRDPARYLKPSFAQLKVVNSLA
jgi:hypothetical protein